MAAESPAVPPTPTILVVDDEDSVRAFIRDALAQEGYTILDSADPLEARRIAESHTVNLLLTDVVMPRMSGLELAERMEAANPAIKVLLMSGYMTATMKASGRLTLAKPFTVDALLRTVREALGSRSTFRRSDPR